METLITRTDDSNAGNWQWLSCVAFFSQFYRCYSPVAHGRGWDKHGAFVRRYVPELQHYSDAYVYEPWKAPIADQKAWGCVVKGDGGAGAGSLHEDVVRRDGEYHVYPKPMFDFAERREVCIKAMKKAYAVGLYGNDKRVLDGSWRGLFEDDAEGPTEGSAGPPGAMGDGEGVDEDDGELKRKPEKKTDPVVGQKRRANARGQMTLDNLVKKVKK